MAAEYPIPFRKQHQLHTGLDSLLKENSQSPEDTENGKLPEDAEGERLPGYPGMFMRDADSLRDFLTDDLCTPELDTMAPHLWIMSTPSSSNVNPLNTQKVKEREIILCEFPRYHLVWIDKRIFIKPLPKYLLSYAFWEKFLVDPSTPLQADRDKLFQAAKGFLRTYSYLIKYESDFDIAQKARLIPQEVKWEGFSEFIRDAKLIGDQEVSPRYCYGELRLSRLNFYAKFFLPRWRYEWGRPQYSAFLSRFYAHFLFIFAVLSILLSAMQVELAVETLTDTKWVPVWDISRYFSTICLALGLLVAVAFILLPTGMFIDEWIYAIRERRKKRRRLDTE